jgi:hypothetical protein
MVPSLSVLILAFVGSEDWLDLLVAFFSFVVLTATVMTWFLRFLVQTHRGAAAPAFVHRTKRVSLLDEDLGVLIQVAGSAVVAIVLVLKYPEVGGMVAGVYAGNSLIFLAEAIILRRLEIKRGTELWEPSARGSAPSGCYELASEARLPKR